MKVSFEKIKEIVTGVSYIEKKDNYIQFHRLSKAEEEYYKNADYMRHYSTSGVRLEFITDSSNLKLKVHVREATPAFYFSHDILLNGKKIGDISNFDILNTTTRKPVGDFKLGDFEGSFVLGKGLKRVSVVFPWSVNSMLEALKIDDDAVLNAIEKPKKLIAYGDSISYGASSAYPCDRYLSKLSDALGAQELCKAIGGECFCPGLVSCAEPVKADLITVAYGTNDITFDINNNNFDEIKSRCSDFFENLSNVYPEVPVFVISPVWRADCDEGESLFKFKRMENFLYEISKKHENFVFVNGYDLIPHNAACYADSIHPNDIGFAHYAANLLRFIRC